jgi:hypothetical protein
LSIHQIRVLDERIAELLRAVPPPLPPTPHPQALFSERWGVDNSRHE